MTMTEEERSVMLNHLSYWDPYLASGLMIVMGPALMPQGGVGVGIVQVDSEDKLKELLDNDPAVALHKYEYYPMLAAKVGKVQ